MSEYYHDDPIEYSEPKSKKFPGFVAFLLFIFAGGSFLQTTLAANITLNSGPIEFGQGITVTAACAGSTNLTVTPISAFSNGAGAGAYYLSGVTVTGIPSSCFGKDINISAFDDSAGSSALPIFNGTQTTATIYNNDGTFEQGFQGTGSTVSSFSGGFTVTFDSPVALSSQAIKFTLQSSEHKDWFIASISVGGAHVCTTTSSGAAKCWGFNGSGQLGDATIPYQRNTPTGVSGLSSGVAVISAGTFGPGEASHTCAVTSAGAAKCWGNNGNGQLGDSTTTARNTPVDVSSLSSGVKTISVGYAHTCALLKTGAVKCWGLNNYGQLGDNSTTQSLIPVNVSGLSSGVTAISAGQFHNCALLNTGGVKCWGIGFGGRIGDNGGVDRKTPVDVSGLSSGVKAISTTFSHTCALLNTGAVRCWGSNTFGQLGDNSTTQRNTPVDVSGLSSGVTSIGVGTSHTCAVLSTGAAKCWGRNHAGQLGDGSTTQRLTPVDVSSLSSGVNAIGGGDDYTCALLNTGAAKCWGQQWYGQLGNGVSANALRTTPVDVLNLP